MKKHNLLTIQGAYWFFHPIGTGLIFTYHTLAKQVMITCESTGQLINTVDMYREGGYTCVKDFKSEALLLYDSMIQDGVTLNLDYMDNPTIIGCIGFDFKILKN